MLNLIEPKSPLMQLGKLKNRASIFSYHNDVDLTYKIDPSTFDPNEIVTNQ